MKRMKLTTILVAIVLLYFVIDFFLGMVDFTCTYAVGCFKTTYKQEYRAEHIALDTLMQYIEIKFVLMLLAFFFWLYIAKYFKWW